MFSVCACIAVAILLGNGQNELRFLGKAVTHRTVVETEIARKRNSNFAGHYRIVEWGEGAGAGNFAVVDLRKNMVYDGLAFGPCGVFYTVDSPVIVLNPEGPSGKGVCKPKLYEWKETRFAPVK